MTRESLRESIEEHFGKIPDQRVVTRSTHKLVDIIAIAILAILCGADGWVAIETYGQAKEEWLKGILHKGRDLFEPNPFLPHDFLPCFASSKAKREYYNAIWFTRISELKCRQI